MDIWADFLISKLKWKEGEKTIESFIVHEDRGDTVSKGIERKRSWIIEKLKNGNSICCIYRGENGKWNKGNSLMLKQEGVLSWKNSLPLILCKRKTFISTIIMMTNFIKKNLKTLLQI